MQEELYTMKGASKILGITKQGVYMAVRSGRLKYRTIRNKVRISKEDIDDYVKSKHKRNVFVADNLLTINQMASMLNVPIQRIYYLIRRKVFPMTKIGGSYFIDKDEFQKILEQKKSKIFTKYCHDHDC